LKKYLYAALIGFVIAIVLCGAIFLWLNRPGPVADPKPEVTINPSPEALKKAETVKEINHTMTIKQPDKMTVDKPVAVPVTVKVKDVTTNTVQEATATAEAVKTPEGDIKVTLPEVIAVDVPKAPPKTNEAGVMYDGDLTVYYKKDLVNVWGVAPWVGAAYNVGNKEFKMAAGVSVRW
jgi:hypothetical protein